MIGFQGSTAAILYWNLERNFVKDFHWREVLLQNFDHASCWGSTTRARGSKWAREHLQTYGGDNISSTWSQKYPFTKPCKRWLSNTLLVLCRFAFCRYYLCCKTVLSCCLVHQKLVHQFLNFLGNIKILSCTTLLFHIRIARGLAYCTVSLVGPNSYAVVNLLN